MQHNFTDTSTAVPQRPTYTAADLIGHRPYVDEAMSLGYRLMHDGRWRHAGLGFCVDPVPYCGGGVDRYHTLIKLRETLAAEQSAVAGRRFIAGALVLLALAVFVAALMAWPNPAKATSRDEAIALAIAISEDRGTPIARCDQEYTLAPGALTTMVCHHAGVSGRARISVQSGNAAVLASLAEQRHRPGSALITLYNPGRTAQSGVAVVEVWRP